MRLRGGPRATVWAPQSQREWQCVCAQPCALETGPRQCRICPQHPALRPGSSGPARQPQPDTALPGSKADHPRPRTGSGHPWRRASCRERHPAPAHPPTRPPTKPLPPTSLGDRQRYPQSTMHAQSSSEPGLPRCTSCRCGTQMGLGRRWNLPGGQGREGWQADGARAGVQVGELGKHGGFSWGQNGPLEKEDGH